MEYGILTTRFNNDTFFENIRWRQNHNFKGCIYSLRTKVSPYLTYNKPFFVLEMNNSINKIMGIGIISLIRLQEREIIYSDPSYNLYTYKGNHYISIYENDDYNLENKDLFIELFEKPLFYGKGHMKRGQSMTQFPAHKVTKKHIDYLLKLKKKMLY